MLANQAWVSQEVGGKAENFAKQLKVGPTKILNRASHSSSERAGLIHPGRSALIPPPSSFARSPKSLYSKQMQSFMPKIRRLH